MKMRNKLVLVEFQRVLPTNILEEVITAANVLNMTF